MIMHELPCPYVVHDHKAGGKREEDVEGNDKDLGVCVADPRERIEEECAGHVLAKNLVPVPFHRKGRQTAERGRRPQRSAAAFQY